MLVYLRQHKAYIVLIREQKQQNYFVSSNTNIFINTAFLSTNALPYLLKRYNFRISTNKFIKKQRYGYSSGLCHCTYSAMCARTPA